MDPKWTKVGLWSVVQYNVGPGVAFGWIWGHLGLIFWVVFVPKNDARERVEITLFFEEDFCIILVGFRDVFCFFWPFWVSGNDRRRNWRTNCEKLLEERSKSAYVRAAVHT